MGSVKDFAAVNTKIYALKGKMLTNEDYVKLMSQKTVKDIAAYLKEHTNYRKVLKDIKVEEIHRGELELLLKRYIVFQYEKLIHYFTGAYKKLFATLFIRFEIEDIKLYLRALFRGESISHIHELIVYKGIYNKIDYEKIGQAKNIEEFIEGLRGTIYYPVLKPFLNEKGEKMLFYFEMSLDGLYFNSLQEQITYLSKGNEKIIREALGRNVDLLNLEWIYRGLKYFKLSPEELINYTLKGGEKLKYQDLKKFCYLNSEEEFIGKMLKTPYSFLFDHKKTIDLFMERRMERYLYFQFLDYFNKGGMDIVIPIAYIHLLEYEVRDIMSITEAIRYSLEKEKIVPYLIRRVKGSAV